MRSVYDAIKSLFSFRPSAQTATANGTAVDTQGYNSLACTLEVGAVSGTSPTLDVKLQESDTSGGTYTDISGATFTQVTAANSSQVIRLDGLNTGSRKRFIRAAATIAGTTPSFTLAANLLLGRAFREPVQ